MSLASDHAVAWVEHHLPGLTAGNTEPEDVIANVLLWAEARGAEIEEWHAEELIAKALSHFHAERGEGDDFANDPYYNDLLAQLLERTT